MLTPDGFFFVIMIGVILGLIISVWAYQNGNEVGREQIYQKIINLQLGEWIETFPEKKFRFYTPEEAIAIREAKKQNKKLMELKNET